MTRLVIAVFCAMWMASAAADGAAQAAPGAQAQPPMNAPTENPPAENLPAVNLPAVNLPAVNPPASAVEDTNGKPADQGASAVQATQAEEPKSSIPLDKRKGGDITNCLGDGNRTDKEIAACAEPYSPLHDRHPQQRKKQ